MVVEKFFNQWQAAETHPRRNQIRGDMLNQIGKVYSLARREDFEFLEKCLKDERRYFAANVLFGRSVPRRLFMPMIHAAIREQDPSRNQYFIQPLQISYGMRPVVEALLAYLDSCDHHEKASVFMAFYWAQAVPTRRCRERRLKQLRKEAKTMEDVWEKIRRRRLEELVANSDVEVVRVALAGTDLRFSRHPPRDWWLVLRSIFNCMFHKDEYVRHRLGVSRGRPSLYKAIPTTSKTSVQGNTN